MSHKWKEANMPTRKLLFLGRVKCFTELGSEPTNLHIFVDVQNKYSLSLMMAFLIAQQVSFDSVLFSTSSVRKLHAIPFPL